MNFLALFFAIAQVSCQFLHRQVKRQEGKQVSCTVASDFVTWSCTLSNQPAGTFTIFLTIPSTSSTYDNDGITLSVCMLKFNPSDFSTPQQFVVSVPGKAQSGSIANSQYSIDYQIRAPKDPNHLCTGEFTSKRTYYPSGITTVCSVSGDPHIFPFTYYHNNNLLSFQNGGVGAKVPAYVEGQYILIQSTMGLFIHVDYNTDCLFNNNAIFNLPNNEILSCVAAIYVQYKDQAIIVTMNRGSDSTSDAFSINSKFNPGSDVRINVVQNSNV